MSQVDYKKSRIVDGNIELNLVGLMDQIYWDELIKEKDLSIPTFVESTVPFGMVSIQNYEIVAGAYNEVASPVKVLRDLLAQKELFVSISFNFMLPFYGLDVVISNDEFKPSRISEHDLFILPNDVSKLTLSNHLKSSDGIHLLSNTRFMEVMTKLRHTIVTNHKKLLLDGYDNQRDLFNHLELNWVGCPSEGNRPGSTDHTKLKTKLRTLQKRRPMTAHNVANSLEEMYAYTQGLCSNQASISRARNFTGIPYTATQKATSDVRTKLRQHNHYERWKTWGHFTSYVEVTKPEELTFGLLTS